MCGYGCQYASMPDAKRSSRSRAKRERNVPARRPLATAVELCDFLGISINTLYDWRKKGTAPKGAKVGRELRFDWDDVDAWVSERAATAA